MQKLIIYHSNCTDGWCSAWLCHLVWPDAEFISANYGWDPPDVTGKDVLMVDFTYVAEKEDPQRIMRELKAKAAALRVLDHHETAEKALAGLDYCTFDQSKSGAHLTWDYLVAEGLLVPHEHWPIIDTNFFKPIVGEPKLHWLVQYVEDYDLHTHALPHHHEICAAIRNHDTEFEVWDELSKRSAESLIAEGRPLVRYQNWLIDHHVRYVQVVEINGHKGLGVQCSMNKLWTKVADGIMAKYPDIPFAAIWQDTMDGFRIYSLRSRGNFHVGQLAESLGGGGHPGAAAFKVNFQTTLDGPVVHSKPPRPDNPRSERGRPRTHAGPSQAEPECGPSTVSVPGGPAGGGVPAEPRTGS